MRRAFFFSIRDKKRAAPEEWIDPILLRVSLALRPPDAGPCFDKLIVARPKRKLVHHVLRLDDVNGRMTGAFRSFVAQIKGNLRRAIPGISNEKQFLPGFCFEIAANFFDRASGGFPSAHAIARITSPQLKSSAANEIRVERHDTH